MPRRETAIAVINAQLRRNKSPLLVAVENEAYVVREHPTCGSRKVPLHRLEIPEDVRFLVEEETLRFGLAIEWNATEFSFRLDSDPDAICEECGGTDALDDYDDRLLCSYCRIRAQDEHEVEDEEENPY